MKLTYEEEKEMLKQEIEALKIKQKEEEELRKLREEKVRIERNISDEKKERTLLKMEPAFKAARPIGKAAIKLKDYLVKASENQRYNEMKSKKEKKPNPYNAANLF